MFHAPTTASMLANRIRPDRRQIPSDSEIRLRIRRLTRLGG